MLPIRPTHFTPEGVSIAVAAFYRHSSTTWLNNGFDGPGYYVDDYAVAELDPRAARIKRANSHLVKRLTEDEPYAR